MSSLYLLTKLCRKVVLCCYVIAIPLSLLHLMLPELPGAPWQEVQCSPTEEQRFI